MPAENVGAPFVEMGRSSFRRRRGAARVSAAGLFPVVLALLAGTAAYSVLADRSVEQPIVEAARSIPVGARIDAADTRTVEVHAADVGLEADLLVPAQVGSGWVAAVPLERGEPLTRAEVSVQAGRAVLGEMSIPVAVQDAAGGRFVPGDTVDVISAGASGSAHYVAQELRVIAVAPGPAPGVLGAGVGSYYVVVQVGKATALRIAGALAASSSLSGSGLQLVLSTGEAVWPVGTSSGRPGNRGTGSHLRRRVVVMR